MADAWGARVKDMRAKLKLNQQHFAGLLGISVMAVSRWENGSTTPTGLSALVLELLWNASGVHHRQTLLDFLRRAGPEPLGVVRMLTWLERHPSIPEGPASAHSTPPPSSRHRPPFSV